MPKVSLQTSSGFSQLLLGSVIFTRFTMETNTGSWVWVRFRSCQAQSLWCTYWLSFLQLLSSVPPEIREMFTVQLWLLFNTGNICKLVLKTQGGFLDLEGLFLSVCSNHTRVQVCTSSDIQWQQWAGDWLDRVKFGVQWDYPTCFFINLISSWKLKFNQKNVSYNRIGISAVCTYAIAAWRFSFALVCPPVSIVLCPTPPQHKRFSFFSFLFV